MGNVMKVTQVSDPEVEELRRRALEEESYTGDPEADRIVDAAWVVLERSGWAGLKVDLVLAEAGLSTRSFYRHFKSKSELLLVLLEGESRRAAQRLEIRASGFDDPAEQVAAWIAAFIGLGRHPSTSGRTKLFLTMWAILDHEFPDEVARCRATLLAPLVRILEGGKANGAFPVAEPDDDAVAIYSLGTGQLMELKRSSRADADHAIEQTQNFALRALRS
jgi:AcrR family transcriptional regulator